MHDTLIQGCASVSALLEAHSSMAQGQQDTTDELLECARTQLRSTLEEARQAVWGLRSVSDSASDLGSLLAKISQQFSHEFSVPVECSVSGESFPLNQSTVHEVLMIVREGLYNAIRHAQPKKIKLSLEFEREKCVLKISDDGSGFDARAQSSHPENHYGLLGMRERVERIEGHFALRSAIGTGTEITIEIPKKQAISTPVPETTI
jgi:signal transduction histidine kinase